MVVSAWISEDAAETARRAGAIEVLSKPIDIKRLLSVFDHQLAPAVIAQGKR